MKVTPLQFLTAVAYYVRTIGGFKNRKTAGPGSTADMAVTALQTGGVPYPTLDDSIFAEEAIGFIDAMEGTNDFVTNMKKFVLAVDIDLTNKFATGTAAYAIEALHKEMAKEERAMTNKDSKSTHVGAEGDRIEFVGKHLSYNIRQNADGSSYSVTRVEDTKGNVFQMYGLASKTPGDAVAVKGTVRKHLERDGIKFTTLNRALWTDGTGITEAEEKALRRKARQEAKAEKLKVKSEKFEAAVAAAVKPEYMPCANSVRLGCKGTVWAASNTNLCGSCLLHNKPVLDEPGQAEANEP